MAKNDKVDALVSTVHDLNHEVRPKVNDVPGGDPPGNPLHVALGELRDHEASVSLVIRSLTIADLTANRQEAQVIDQQSIEEVGSRQLLSSFGTARAAILSIIRMMEDEEWDRERETQQGTTTITEVIDELIESDKVLAAKVRNAAN